MQIKNKEFQFHALNPEGASKAGQIALAFDDLLEELVTLCPAGRELSIVRTKLEEASFFAKKAMAGDPANQAAPPSP